VAVGLEGWLVQQERGQALETEGVLVQQSMDGARWGGMLPGTGTGSSASWAGHGQPGCVTQDPGEALRRDGCLQGSGTKVRERGINSKPLAALSR